MAEARAESEWVAPTGKGHWSKAEGRKMVEALRQSGETRAAFAKRHGLHVHRVKYWLDRVEGTGGQALPTGHGQRPAEMAFAPVRIVDSAPEELFAPAPLEVVIGAAVVRVPPGFDEAHLRRVVQALGGGA